MHVHLPKPLHGWGAFFGEVGVIVIGILIALSAEQLVEGAHWRHKVEAVKEAVRHELADDDLPQAYARVVIARCLSRQLDSLRRSAEAGGNGQAFLRAAALYTPPARTWDAEAQRLADRSDLAAHLTTDELEALESPYRYVARLEALSEQEQSHARALQHSRYGSGPLTKERAAEINDTVDALQYDNRQIAAFSWAALESGRTGQGIALAADQKRRILGEARDVYGDCAAEFVPPNNLGNRQIFKPSGKGTYEGL